jgi:hypothetical protein
MSCVCRWCTQDVGVRFYLKRYAAEPLIRMLVDSEDRWEKRDAATALLKLQLTQVRCDVVCWCELSPEQSAASMY